MDFELTSEEKMWAKTINDFMRKDVGRDYVYECDRLRKYPYEVYDKVIKNGWLGTTIPEAYGGDSCGTLMHVLFCENIAQYGVDFGLSMVIPLMTVDLLLRYGTESQKKQYIPAFLQGKVRFSISITEPGAGSDAAALSTKATMKDGMCIINGQKVFASAAHVEGNIIACACRTDSSPNDKHHGISIILVPNDTPGLDIRKLETISRRCTGTAELFFDNVCVPQTNIVGELHKGWQCLTGILELERITVASMAVGNAQNALNEAILYLTQRIQFGRPLSKFQALRHMVAELQTSIDAARLLTYRAAVLHSQEKACAKESSMAKLFASEVFQKVATAGMQMLGGYAQLPEYHMERYWREAQQSTVGGGTSQIHKNILSNLLI